MKKSIAIPLVLAVVIIGALVFVFWPEDAPEPQINTQRIEDHLKEHINDLSTKPAVLGGTFYVTAIELTPSGTGVGRGVVQYEDGHVAYTADFSYSADDFRGVEITNFVTRK